MRRRCLLIWFALLGALAITEMAVAQVPARPDYKQHVEPILQTLCYDCHGGGADEGGVQFDDAKSLDALRANKSLWGKAWDNILAETMPPGDALQPTWTERRILSRWIGQSVFEIDSQSVDPGRVTIRRLNREEYRYSILDLLGVDFPVDEHFPVDDTGYGFDTIGDVLTIPPTLMDKYFEAAAKISEGLLSESTRPLKERSIAHRRLFSQTESAKSLEVARQVISRVATIAYRQPADKATVDRLLSLAKPDFEAGAISFEQLVCRAIEPILVSPRFLYRAEFQPRPDDPQSDYPLDEFALASRLSFFLWSSLPDDELLELAAKGQLRKQLDFQVSRMLHDRKSRRMVENFVGQWLQTRDVQGIHRSRKMQKRIWNLRKDMRQETYEFFAYIMREDRNVIELISADYSFLTEKLAELYEIPDVKGNKPQLVKFPPGSPRGGVLTHASVLMVTSNPDRTSPVKRGLFVLDNILGSPAPPAPPDVPALEDSKDSKDEKVSLRVQLERHRADPSCATCHDRMDPLGLGLENFDAIGRWREEEGGQPIDASSQLASGEVFSDIRELRTILTQKRRLFYRCLTKKLMTYALGRGIEYTDNVSVETIVNSMIREDGRFSTMLMGIIESPQFQRRRGNDSQSVAAVNSVPKTPVSEDPRD